MLKGLLMCTLACGAASPATAGDKSAPALSTSVKAIAAASERITYGLRKVAPVITPSSDVPPVAFTLPAGAAALKARTPTQMLSGEAHSINTRFTLRHSQDPWDAPDAASPVTADAGASYAVTEALNDRYKPRERRSRIRTVLSLHLDGQEESPAFSVGGSAVTAAVWRAMPR